VVSCPQHGTDAEKLLELADTAMFRAKAAGERIAEAVVPESAPEG
jgi:predicted signal transduction protein with EAL and GGDEF domain